MVPWQRWLASHTPPLHSLLSRHPTSHIGGFTVVLHQNPAWQLASVVQPLEMHCPVFGSQVSPAMQSDGVLMQFFATQTLFTQVWVVGLHSLPPGVQALPLTQWPFDGLAASRSHTRPSF